MSGGVHGKGGPGRPLRTDRLSLSEATAIREMEEDAAAALAALSSLRQRVARAPETLGRPEAGVAEALARIDAALGAATRAFHAARTEGGGRPAGRPRRGPGRG